MCGARRRFYVLLGTDFSSRAGTVKPQISRRGHRSIEIKAGEAPFNRIPPDDDRRATPAPGDFGAKYGARLILAHVRLWHARSDTLRALADRRALPKKLKSLLDDYEDEYLMEMARAGVATGFDHAPPHGQAVRNRRTGPV